MSDCADPRISDLLGAYALGACTPREQEDVREHLHSCAACTTDLLELGAAREALLTAVPPASAPPELKSRVMSQVRADAELFAAARARESGGAHVPPPAHPREGGRFGRLRTRVPLAAAAASAVVLALGAGALGAALLGGGDGGGAPRTISAKVNQGQAPGASAQLVVDQAGGSRLVVDGLPAPGRGRVYQVWLRSGHGTPRPAGALFAVDRTGAGQATVPGPLTGVDEVLVSSEPAGGSTAPTRAPIIAAQL